MNAVYLNGLRLVPEEDYFLKNNGAYVLLIPGWRKGFRLYFEDVGDVLREVDVNRILFTCNVGHEYWIERRECPVCSRGHLREQVTKLTGWIADLKERRKRVTGYIGQNLAQLDRLLVDPVVEGDLRGAYTYEDGDPEEGNLRIRFDGYARHLDSLIEANQESLRVASKELTAVQMYVDADAKRGAG